MYLGQDSVSLDCLSVTEPALAEFFFGGGWGEREGEREKERERVRERVSEREK